MESRGVIEAVAGLSRSGLSVGGQGGFVETKNDSSNRRTKNERRGDGANERERERRTE